jgi:hypothetical protein
MRLSLLIVFQVLCHALFAQITILNSDMPQAGDTLRFSVANNLNNYTKSGANQVWDFSKITPVTQDVQRYYTPTSTPYFLQFFNASYGLPEQIDLGPVGGNGFASNVFGFYRSTNAALVSVGKGATVQNLPLGIVYTQRDTIYKFPLNYENTREGYFEGSASLLGLGALVQTGTRKTEVDGWGIITTPYGTFDCIRIKTEVEGTDSISFNGFGIPVPNSRTEYVWLGKNQKFPLMEVVVNNLTQATTIRYKDIYRPELYRNNARFTASRTTASTKDTINLNNQSLGMPTGYSWTITPATYRFVGGTNASSATPRIIFDAMGKYSIKLAVTYNGGYDDTLRTDYITISQGLEVDFTADKPNPGLGETVTFTDKTTGNPIAWQWTINPNAGVQFVEGTSLASQNPKVKFTIKGNYNIRLRATNAAGSVTLTKEQYIQVWPTGLETNFAEKPIFRYFPNPTKESLFLENLLNEPTTIHLSNVLGEVVLSFKLPAHTESSFSIGHLTPGIYFLSSSQDAYKLVEKLVIE